MKFVQGEFNPPRLDIPIIIFDSYLFINLHQGLFIRKEFKHENDELSNIFAADRSYLFAASTFSFHSIPSFLSWWISIAMDLSLHSYLSGHFTDLNAVLWNQVFRRDFVASLKAAAEDCGLTTPNSCPLFLSST